MVLYAPVEPPSMYAITLVLVKTRFNQDRTEKNCISHTAKHVHPVKSTSVIGLASSSFTYLRGYRESSYSPLSARQIIALQQNNVSVSFFYKYDALC